MWSEGSWERCWGKGRKVLEVSISRTGKSWKLSFGAIDRNPVKSIELSKISVNDGCVQLEWLGRTNRVELDCSNQVNFATK